MFSFLNFSHHYRSQNIYPMCSTDPIHHQLHTIVSRYRNSIITNFYISGQMDTQYLYSEFCTKYDNLLKHFTTIHMYVKWCVKNTDIYLLHTSRNLPPWPNFFGLVKIKCKCWLGNDHLTWRGGLCFFSKKNILIPNVVEKNILILVEEKNIIWFRVFVI